MDNFNVNTLPIEEESSPSSSSSSSSSDDDVMIPVMSACLQYQQQVQQQMMFLIQLRQVAIEMTPSTSTPQMKKRCIKRDGEVAHNRLYQEYFTKDSVYNEHHFRCRFRMRRHLFLRIVEAFDNHSEYFQVRYDGAGRSGLSPLAKCIVAMQMLAYGITADCVDEYLKIGASITTECLKKFASCIVEVSGEHYLRKPNQADVDRLLQVAETRDFLGMLGSIDCMHWKWKNCPMAWRALFQKQVYKVPTVILEVVASYDLWIWHAFFELPGSLIDINVLDRSSVFQEKYEDQAPKCEYVVNNHHYNIGYYLSDDIYLQWTTFVKTITLPQGPKKKLFTEHQESVRKDVKRAFGVLQARFSIVHGPARLIDQTEIGIIVRACVILHNMIVEDERDNYEFAFHYALLRKLSQSPLLTTTTMHAMRRTFNDHAKFATPKRI